MESLAQQELSSWILATAKKQLLCLSIYRKVARVYPTEASYIGDYRITYWQIHSDASISCLPCQLEEKLLNTTTTQPWKWLWPTGRSRRSSLQDWQGWNLQLLWKMLLKVQWSCTSGATKCCRTWTTDENAVKRIQRNLDKWSWLHTGQVPGAKVGDFVLLPTTYFISISKSYCQMRCCLYSFTLLAPFSWDRFPESISAQRDDSTLVNLNNISLQDMKGLPLPRQSILYLVLGRCDTENYLLHPIWAFTQPPGAKICCYCGVVDSTCARRLVFFLLILGHLLTHFLFLLNARVERLLLH